MKEEYLFEARTMVAGCPAAAQKVEFYRVDGPLPRLQVNAPKDGLPRSFGLLDEDQSFEIHLRPEYYSSRLYPVRTFERLLDYMDYAGQDALSYSLIRYTGQRFYGSRSNESHKTRLLKPGWVDLLLDLMSKRGVQLLANVNLYTQPLLAGHPGQREAMADRGVSVIDSNGRPVAGWQNSHIANPVHPECRAELLGMTGEMVRRFGKHPAFRGVDIWLMFDSCPIIWNSLEHGYGDYTVALFEKETGTKVPGAENPAARFAARYAFLTGPKRQQWLKWRSQKTTGFFLELADMLRQTRDDLKLHVTVGHLLRDEAAGLGDEEFTYASYLLEKRSIDIEALKQIPSLVLTPMRNTTMYRWMKHWHGGKETVVAEANFDIERFSVFRNGPRSAISLFHRYFESRNDSLKPDKYQSYFQNADVKAAGRYFLRDFAIAIAAQDPAQILCGAQPLGTTGREPEAREFARAFRSLPVGDYQDIPGLGDPVCGRSLVLGDTRYFYLCSLIWSEVSVTLDLGPETRPVNDLSTLEEISPVDGKLTLSLKPYELRSFAVGKGASAIERGTVAPPKKAVAWLAARLMEVRGDLAKMEKHGADVAVYEARLQRIEMLKSAGALAEAHRLIASKLIREIPGELVKAEKGYLKEMAECLGRSEYRVNCGSPKFYRSRGGKLFFSDQPYARGQWGHDGKYQSVGRSHRKWTNTDDPELFQTEAYFLDAYRFAVKPGTYTVRLHWAIGYLPGAKPENFIFNVSAEGKPLLKDFDVFMESGKNVSTVVVRELKGIRVEDGVLDIEFTESVKTPDPSAKLCNAIEVIPEG